MVSLLILAICGFVGLGISNRNAAPRRSSDYGFLAFVAGFGLLCYALIH